MSTVVGVRLLQRMGWRQGKGIGTADPSASEGASKGSRWGRVAGVGVDNTPLYALKPKETLHGLGFDPFKVRPASLAVRCFWRRLWCGAVLSSCTHIHPTCAGSEVRVVCSC